jgi:glycosyltransferase involved in cell wall biosynthesis
MISVVVTTFNNPTALAHVLEGFKRQTSQDFELYVVNDGGPEIPKDLFKITKFQYRYLFPACNDFRLAAARNLGLKLSNGNRVMFVDEDCVPAYNLIEGHLKYSDEKKIVCSNRHAVHDWTWKNVRDNAEITRSGCSPRIRIGIEGKHNNYEVRFFDKYSDDLNRTHYAYEDAWSACTSYPTALIRSLGGFWEEFVGWGGEDSELAMRCVASGCEVLLRPDLCYYHLNHPSRKTEDWEARCTTLFEKSRAMPTLVRNGGPI